MKQIGSNFRRRDAARGFTLIEAAMVTVIIGVGVVAMLQLLAAGSMANTASTELTTGLNLANNIREWTQQMPFTDDGSGQPHLGLLHGRTFQPPRDGGGTPLTGFGDWSQTVRVVTVSPDFPGMPTLQPGIAPWAEAARVTVDVSRSGRQVCSINWLVVEPVN